MSSSINTICAVCAFAFGSLAAYIGLLISRQGINSDTVSGIMVKNFARLLVDIATLGITFFVCRHFVLPLTVCLISAALGLTVCGLLMLRGLAKSIEKKDGGE